MENLIMIIDVVRGNIYFKMEINIMDSGSTIYIMDREHLL